MNVATDLLDPKEFSNLLKQLKEDSLSDDVLIKLERLINRNIPHWHIPMLNDVERNEFYRNMINRHVKGKTIFEIGTGVGLLALMAAEAGATHIYTCEMNPLLYLLATRNIAKSKHKDKITLFFGSSTELNLGEHLPKKVDIILSEIISNDIISEDMLDSLSDAKRFLKKSGIFLPAEIQAHGTLVSLKKSSGWFIETVEDITRELDFLGRFRRQNVNLLKSNHAKISKTINLFTIKNGFKVDPKLPVSFSLKVTNPQKDKNNYFCLHFTIKDGKNKYESYHPESGNNDKKHWHQSVWYLGTANAYRLKLIVQDDRLYLIRKTI